MLVSIIVPVYNCSQYLVACIGSLLSQTYKQIEVIIIDDGSNDGTEILCDQIRKDDHRIKVIHKDNGGISSARNEGLKNVNGDYICFVDSDDIVAPNFVEKLLETANSTSSSIVSCGVWALEGEKTSCYRARWERSGITQYVPDIYIEKMVRGDVSCTVWNKLYRADICKEHSFKEGFISEEILFNFQIAQDLKLKNLTVTEIPDKMYYYRVNENGLTHKKYTKLLEDQALIFGEITELSKGESYYETAFHMYASYLSSLMYHLASSKERYSRIREFKRAFKDIGISYYGRTTSLKNTTLCFLLMYCPWTICIMNYHKQ